jgi:hypothetical protein
VSQKKTHPTENDFDALECIGGPLDRLKFAAYPDDPDGFELPSANGCYVRRSYEQVFVEQCLRDPLKRLLPDVWVYVPFPEDYPG